MFENFYEGSEAAIALSVVGEGLPLVHNGMKAGNAKGLAFFEKDPAVWKDHELNDLFKDLFKLLKDNSALWHAKWGATLIKVPNNTPNEVLSFLRQNEENKVFAVFNFSDKLQNVKFEYNLFLGNYKPFRNSNEVSFNNESVLQLQPYDYRINIR